MGYSFNRHLFCAKEIRTIKQFSFFSFIHVRNQKVQNPKFKQETKLLLHLNQHVFYGFHKYLLLEGRVTLNMSIS